jgi:hypothetical protein
VTPRSNERLAWLRKRDRARSDTKDAHDGEGMPRIVAALHRYSASP